MFEGIVLHSQPDTGTALDAGLLAESLLFFQNVTVLLDYRNAVPLIQQIGPDVFFELVDQKLIHATYSENFPATERNTINDIEQYKFVFMGFASTGAIPKPGTKKALHYEGMLERAGVPAYRRRKLAERFRKTVPIRNLSEFLGDESGKPEYVNDDLADEDFLSQAIRAAIDVHAPDYLKDREVYFRAVGDGGGFYLDTNIDFSELNEIIQKRPGLNDVVETRASLVHKVFSAKTALMLANHYGTGMSVGQVTRRINELKIGRIYRKVTRELQQQQLFQSKAISKIGDIRSAINSGERSFAEFMTLFEKGDKYRSWLKGLHPDDDITDEYYQEVTRQGWAEKLPSKIARFSIFTGSGAIIDALGAGGIGTVAGMGVSAIDSFLLDGIIKGWRPSTYIAEVRNFIEDK